MDYNLQAFVLLWLYRYVRLIINCFSHYTFRPKPKPVNPEYTSENVTIIVPTLDGGNGTVRTMIESMLENYPDEIILVTTESNEKKALHLAADFKAVRVMSVPKANKRQQLCKAIPHVKTKITVLADDDVYWPSTILDWILAPFEDPAMGGVGTCQRLERAESPTFSQRCWNFLGAIYLERRNFDISACTHIDGGLPCLSGRTVAYRTKLLQDENFLYDFTHEKWRKWFLMADDDNFITRWMVSHGWKTYVQYHKEAELTTTLEDNPTFLKQCLRWSRSNWRSNLRSMFIERDIWYKQPWSTYAVHITTLTAWALPTDLLLLYLLWRAAELWPPECQRNAMFALAAWMFVSKWIKLLGHFVRYPVDIFFLPLSIAFGYFHGLLKLYAMMTLRVTTWGSRENADTDDDERLVQLPDYTP